MKPLIGSKAIKTKKTVAHFSVDEIARIFKLGKAEKKLLAERRKLSKLCELERKEFIDFLKSWITKW